MTTSSLFKWRHFAPEIIVCGVRWHLRYALSYRDIAELLLERGPTGQPSGQLDSTWLEPIIAPVIGPPVRLLFLPFASTSR
jgi:hypothetical protein